MNKAVKEEQKVQASFWFVYRVANFFAFLFWVIVLSNDHTFIGLLGIGLQLIFNFVRVPILQAKFDERLKVVAFKTQIENLYVYSLYPEQSDDTVAATFYRTIDLLKQSGNKHEVRVHLVMYQDVKIFTWFYDHSGKLVKTGTWREKGSATETWEEYQFFIEEFERKDRDERLRQLRKDGAGFDWVNENLFYQWNGNGQ